MAAPPANNNRTLFQFGPVQFQVHPLNVHEVGHETATDWARKEIAGAAIYREWVGENDETIKLKGRVFPHFMAKEISYRRKFEQHPEMPEPERSSGGLNELDVLDNIRRLGQSHLLIRGDGTKFGWYVIERLTRGHTFLELDGIGQQIEFEATFSRVPIPAAGEYYPITFSIVSSTGAGPE